jgi:hypothetical protein
MALYGPIGFFTIFGGLDQTNLYILVGGFNSSEKYESQWEGLSHILWKIKFMFETTNHPYYSYPWTLTLTENSLDI